MSPHTDAGALLLRLEIAQKDCFDQGHLAAAILFQDARAEIVRQAASQGRAGGEQSEVQTEPAGWRWKPRRSRNWVTCDKLPEFTEDADVITEPLFTHPAQAVPDPDKTAKEIVSKWIGDCGGYLDLTFIQSELLQERIREYLPPSSLPSAEQRCPECEANGLCARHAIPSATREGK